MDTPTRGAIPGTLRDDAHFGDLAVRQGLCSREQVDECLEILKDLHRTGTGPLPRLGGLLLQKGYVGRAGDDGRTVVMEVKSASGSEHPARPPEDGEMPPEARQALSEPQNFVGKYVRIRLLGVGGMGEVWKAWDRDLKRWVALKFLKGSDPREESRFRGEAQAAARLNHPNICAVYEVGRHEGRPFIAMQFVEGRTLQAVLRGDRRELARIFRDVALAVQRAHEGGVIHRDLKPGNIMVDQRGAVVVMDFGLAKATNVDSSVSVSGSVVGTPAYMPPEQAKGSKDVDGRADVYSLGATMYEVIGGEPVFSGSAVYDILVRIAEEEPRPLRRKLPGFDRELDTIVMKCLEKEPARRYATAQELAEDLRRWLEGEAILAHPPSAFYALRKRLVKRKAVVRLSAVAFLAVAALGVVVPAWRAAKRATEEELAREIERDRHRADATEFLEAGRQLEQQIELLMGTKEFTRERMTSLAAQAETQMIRALEIYPDLPEARLDLAHLRQVTGHRAEALREIGRALLLRPTFSAAFLYRARLRLVDYELLRRTPTGERREETPEAKAVREQIDADLRAAAAQPLQRAERLYADGLLAYSRGDYAEAARILGEYVEKRPADYHAHHWRGRAFLHLNRAAEADASLSAALTFDHDDADMLKDRALARTATGNWDGALEDVNAVLALDPRNAFALILRGNVAFARGNVADALKDYHASLAAKLTWQGYFQVGTAAIAKNDLETAINNLTAAIPFSDGLRSTATILKQMAVVRLRQGQPKPAADLAGRALRADAADPDALWIRGQAREASGEKGDAAADYRKSLESAPPGWPPRAEIEARLKSLPPP